MKHKQNITPNNVTSKHNYLLQILISLLELLIMFLLICGIFRICIPPGSWINVVDGNSMEPTLQNNQIVFSAQEKDLRYGDIVIAQVPIPSVEPAKNTKEPLLIKRVIGMPGDTVSITTEGVFLNGSLLDENYLPATYLQYSYRSSNYNTVTLKENEYFLLGDNRSVSRDSRNFGPVLEKNILYKQSEKPTVNFYIKLALMLVVLISSLLLFAIIEPFLYYVFQHLTKRK